MWPLIIAFIVVYTMLHRILPKFQAARWALGIAALVALPTAASYPNIPPPLPTNDIPLTEAGVAAILAYMTKFASDWSPASKTTSDLTQARMDIQANGCHPQSKDS